jgi:hypothetical protein
MVMFPGATLAKLQLSNRMHCEVPMKRQFSPTFDWVALFV